MQDKRITTTKSYETYPYKKPTHGLYLDKKLYMEIIKLANTKLVEKLIMTGKKVVLPSRLGTLQFKTLKTTKKKMIDFKLTKEIGKTVYHNNLATNGLAVKLVWGKTKYKANFKNKKTWKFKLTRHQQRYNHNSVTKYIQRNGLKHLIKEKDYS